MDLQNTFYLFSLILMGLGIVFLLGCIAFLVYLFVTFRNAKKQLGDAIDRLHADAKRASGAAGMGMYILASVLKKVKSMSADKN